MIRYDDLMEDPADVVRTAFERLELPITPRLEQALEEEGRRPEPHRSRHRYALEEWGFTVDEIVEEYRQVFERYGFPIPEEARQEHAGEDVEALSASLVL